MRALLTLLGLVAVPAVILAGAFAFIFSSAELPAALDAFKVYGPYIVGVAGVALAVGFRSGRALFALITLVAAYAAQQWWLQTGLTTPEARAVYLALTVFVPLNLAVFSAVPERGVFNWHGALRLGLIALEIAATAWVIASGRTDIIDAASRKFVDPTPFGIGAIPQAGIAAVLLGLLGGLASAALTRSAVSAACTAAIVAFTVAAHVPTASLTFSVFTSAAALMLAVAILHDRLRAPPRDHPRPRMRSTVRR